ncbi:hypothetical protein Rain11_2679 [Raineya orbicola]|uniref:Uncharacterized protein n=1 Tax=Raineya orbicola TaxID=2016530 RepID=A0A2N3HWK3_9BACT|nr:hypothetical protein Rain11_2679 [Raineya orbicola]
MALFLLFQTKNFVGGLKEDLSFSFFISNLTDFLSNKSVKKNNFIWYATDKELNLIRQF